MRLEQPLGLRLRDHQQVIERRVDIVESDAGDDLLAGKDGDGLGLEPGRREGAGAAGPVEKLERPRPNRERFRLVRPRWSLVDDADRHAIAGKLGGHRQADGARAGDEDASWHGASPKGAASGQYIEKRGSNDGLLRHFRQAGFPPPFYWAPVKNG